MERLGKATGELGGEVQTAMTRGPFPELSAAAAAFAQNMRRVGASTRTLCIDAIDRLVGKSIACANLPESGAAHGRCDMPRASVGMRPCVQHLATAAG